MTESWQSAWVEVLPDFSEFRSKANKQMGSILGDAGDSAGVAGGKAMNGGILGSVGKLGGPLAGAFAALGIGAIVGNAISSGVDYALDGTKLASSLSETKSAIGQVFGEAGAGIETFAKDANARLGQTQQQALDAAKTFGIFGQSAGLAGKPLTTFSTDLVTLATDLASFNDTSPQEAIDALGAGLRGEAEPLRKYGILLDDASLRSKAMELGIYDGNGALTSQQRILATNAAIFDKSITQQGDFARTSAGMAGQQKILAASFQDAQTALGTALLPAMTQFTTFANTTLVPALTGVIDQVGPILAEALTTSLPAFTELIVALAPLIPDLVTLGAELLPILVGGLIAIAPLLIDWANNTTAIVGTINDLFSLIGGNMTFEEFSESLLNTKGTVADLGRAIGSFIGEAIAHFSAFLGGVTTNISGVVSTLISLPGKAVAALGNLGSLLVSSGRALIQGFIDGIENSIGAVGDAVGGVMDYVAGFFPHSPAERGPFSGSGWAAVYDAGTAITDQFSAGLGGSRAAVDMSSLVSIGGVTSPPLSAAMVGSGSMSGSDRPIMMDGNLFGMLREMANGEAHIVVNSYDRRSGLTDRMGVHQ
jgi:phage-related protein